MTKLDVAEVLVSGVSIVELPVLVEGCVEIIGSRLIATIGSGILDRSRVDLVNRESFLRN